MGDGESRQSAGELIRRGLDALALVLGALGLVGYGCALLGRFHWFLDLATHFQVQYAFALLSAGIIGLGRRRRARAAVALTLGMAAAWEIAPLYLSPARPHQTGGPPVDALYSNVNTGNDRYADLARIITEEDPMILGLVEVDDRWLAALAPVTGRYRHRLERPRRDNFGIALYSKLPGTFTEEHFPGLDLPFLRARLSLPAGTPGPREISVWLVHVLPPGREANSRARDDQITYLAESLEAAPGPHLVLGDLNASRFCSTFKTFLARAGLTNSEDGRGFQPTWPAGFPPLYTVIDHALAGPGFAFTERRVLATIGSDHHPLRIRGALEAP